MGWVVTAGLLGLVAGAAQLRCLRLLGYRRNEEQQLLSPRNQLWVVPVTALTAMACVARFTPGRPMLLLVLLPLALTGVWLAAVDLDVQRLPDRVVVPLAAWTAVAALILGYNEGAPTAVVAAAGGLGTASCLWVIHAFSRGGLGFGDVKLGAVTATAAAAVSPAALWWSLMGAFTMAAAWAAATRRRDLALGPWLTAGALLAALWGSP